MNWKFSLVSFNIWTAFVLKKAVYEKMAGWCEGKDTWFFTRQMLNEFSEWGAYRIFLQDEIDGDCKLLANVFLQIRQMSQGMY